MGIGDSQSSNNSFEEYCREISRNIRNNHVVLLNCPKFNFESFEPDVARNRCYYAYPPTGLQYLADSVSHRGLDLSILDLNFELLKKVINEPNFDYHNWTDILDEFLKRKDPSVIGVSNLFSIDKPNFIKTLEHLKSRGDKSIIVAGGQNATYEGERLLETGLCHFICERESENKLNYLFDHLYSDRRTKPTPGILFKHDGKIKRTSGAKDIVQLNGNLIGAHKLVPIEEYCRVGTLNPYSRMTGKNVPFATVLFNRGCEGNCRFCGVVDYMGHGVRSREIKDFLEEIEYLVKERGVGHIDILDDDFARYPDKAKQVLSGMIKKGIKTKWSSGNGMIARTLDEQLMGLMRDTGCVGFKVGVESGNQEILKKIHKPGNLEIFRAFSQMAKKFPEMFIVDNYIIGFPEETFGQMMDSYRFSLEMDLDWSAFSVYQHNVRYFGNEEERKKGSNVIGDFVPTKDSFRGKLVSSERVFSGIDIFNLPADNIPSREQLGEIWFSFNLARNFVHNKNLNDEHDVRKFLSWTTEVQERYPTHPYLSLFVSLANHLIRNTGRAEEFRKITEVNLKDPYWREKSTAAGLDEIISDFPKNAIQAKDALEALRQKYSSACNHIKI